MNYPYVVTQVYVFLLVYIWALYDCFRKFVRFLTCVYFSVSEGLGMFILVSFYASVFKCFDECFMRVLVNL